jgi:hypothetical protein
MAIENIGQIEQIEQVIQELAITLQTNGIQELDHELRGGVSAYSYVRGRLLHTAYRASQASHTMSFDEFYRRVEVAEGVKTQKIIIKLETSDPKRNIEIERKMPARYDLDDTRDLFDLVVGAMDEELDNL